MNKIRFLPKTKLGKWSVGLIILMPILFFVGMFLMNRLYSDVPAGKTIFKDIFARPGLALSMLLGFACGIFAFVAGLLAIIKNKERSVLVFISTIIGALLILFLALEVAFPH